MALADADTQLASGRPDFSYLPSRSSLYAVRGEVAQGSAVPVNSSLLALFERPLRPNLQLGLTIREAAALEASFRANSESLSHSMWLLSGLLAFVRLQGFTHADSSLFHTSLSKSLDHQAAVSASHTVFIGLKRRQFYLSHLPTYFSEVSKRAMLSSPFVCSDSLFAESDVARLLVDTQASSSLRSQQALVDVASRGSGAHCCRFRCTGRYDNISFRIKTPFFFFFRVVSRSLTQVALV